MVKIEIDSIEAAGVGMFFENAVRELELKKIEQGLTMHEEIVLSGLRSIDGQIWKQLNDLPDSQFNKDFEDYTNEANQSKLN